MARVPRLARAISEWQTPIILSALLIVLAILGTLFGDAQLKLRITTMMMFAVVVVGLYIFIGNSGVVSFGHISFMAIGAYVAGVLTVPTLNKQALLPDLPTFIQNIELDILPATIAGGIAAAVFAIIIAPSIMRLNGIAASIAMLSVLVIVNVVIRETEAFTRGQKTLTGIPQDETVLGPLLWVIVAVFVAFAYQRTRYGLKLRAAREDEFGAKAAGIYIPRERTIALVLSGFFVGVGGALYGHLLGSIAPQLFFVGLTFTTLVMLVVGGINSLSGAVIGTVTIFAFTEILQEVETGNIFIATIPERSGIELVGLAVVALLILILRPDGLTRNREVRIPKRWLPGGGGSRADGRDAGVNGAAAATEPTVGTSAAEEG